MDRRFGFLALPVAERQGYLLEALALPGCRPAFAPLETRATVCEDAVGARRFRNGVLVERRCCRWI